MSDLKRMREIGIARLAQLRAMLFSGKLERPTKHLDIARRTGLPDLLDQFEKARLQRARGALWLAAARRPKTSGLFERRHRPHILGPFDESGEERVPTWL